VKNILTNIVGFIIVGLSIYALLRLELEVIKFSILTVLGLSLIYFENSTIKDYIKKALDKLLK
tara:strand:+ start:1282 stop:1470 length:189 start_codon:yes stop_codon:yes gene_type:complete